MANRSLLLWFWLEVAQNFEISLIFAGCAVAYYTILDFSRDNIVKYVKVSEEFFRIAAIIMEVN